ncbi:hypothetical protein 2019_scaffold132_00041 [Bacteriophage sp.]|nr:hypothetical protein 2019_scaffold132_00041 [Bacteriophage sp.]
MVITPVRCLSVTTPVSHNHSLDVLFLFRLRDALEHCSDAFHKFCFFKIAAHV